MSSPFPGMDPYLEMQPDWSDFAPTFLGEIRNELLRQVLPRYNVRIEEYLMLSEEDFALHRVRPDVALTTQRGLRSGVPAAAVAADATTLELEYPDFDTQTQREIRVIHRDSERVVTVIELLSPSNKAPGEGGLDLYSAKRAELLACPCNLVELDLLRGGERLPMAGGPLPPGDYYAFIGRLQRKPRCEVIGWPLRAKMPTIPIPLLPEDGEVPLDLQKVFTAAYEPALFDRRLPYHRPLVPPLAPHDEDWVRDALTKVAR